MMRSAAASLGRRSTLAALCATLGAVYARAPSFSGLALVVVLLTGAGVAVAVFASVYPRRGSVPSPPWHVLRWWLLWAVVVVAVETAVLLAGDDLRWPTISAIQDPVTSRHPAGRFIAGAGWTAAGLGLITLTRRYRGLGDHTLAGRWTAAATGAGLGLLAIGSVGRGPLLRPGDGQAPDSVGIDTTAIAQWPLTAWLTIAVFVGAALCVVALHRLGRSTAPPAALPDLFAWLMAPWLGRLLVFSVWLWCGWHFLAR